MKKVLILLYPVFLFLLAGGCQKKQIELELVETACKNLRISNPTHFWVSDPSCSGSPLTARFDITFAYDGKQECIDHIDLVPKFYNINNSEIGNVNYSARLSKSSSDLSIGTGTVTFTFRFTFANASDANSLNHIYLKFHVENELETESNKLEVRLNGNCSAVSSSSYDVKTTVPVTSNTVQVTLFDDAAEDGDIVSVYLNGVWVLENYTLTKAGQTFNWNISSGNNHLVLFAVNEGSSGPNTCAISINGGSQISLSPDLLTGEAINIQF